LKTYVDFDLVRSHFAFSVLLLNTTLLFSQLRIALHLTRSLCLQTTARHMRLRKLSFNLRLWQLWVH